MRKPTPDILSDLMGENAKPSSNKEIELESNKAIKQQIIKAVKQESGKAIKPVQMFMQGMEEPSSKVEDEVKEKATFNLPLKLLGELEDKCHEIRKLCGSKQVSKTLIVEEALRMAFAEFDLKRETGRFYGKIASNKAIKQ